MNLFKKQYEWIQRTRETLFSYCEQLSPSDYVKELENFEGDSIRNLHTHVANCYRIWLGNRALGKPLLNIEPESIHNVNDMRESFKRIDELVYEFLNEFDGEPDKTIPVTFSNGGRKEFTTLWLFTHTTTHEFHHKGQIVKIGRQLGYTPPDTDLLEPTILIEK